MWSSRKINKLLIGFLVIGGFSFLSACGFRPLYGNAANSKPVKSALASITVAEPKTRLQQVIRNHLVYLLSSDEAAPARYKLKFTATEQETNVLVQRSTQVDRQIYQIDIKFELFDLSRPDSKVPLYKGTDVVKLSYTRTASEFNNIRAKKSASEKAGKRAAENLHIRLAAWFARNRAS